MKYIKINCIKINPKKNQENLFFFFCQDIPELKFLPR